MSVSRRLSISAARNCKIRMPDEQNSWLFRYANERRILSLESVHVVQQLSWIDAQHPTEVNRIKRRRTAIESL